MIDDQHPTLPMWRTTRSAYLVNDRFIRVRADECETESGARIAPYYVLEYPDWVHVVAMDAPGRVLVIQQYRHAAGIVCAELPGGTVEQSDETVEAAARRELLEETGYGGGFWECVASVAANPATHTNYVHCLLARGVVLQQAPAADPTEVVTCELVPVEAVLALVDSGVFAQSMHVASLMLALRRLGWFRSARTD